MIRLLRVLDSLLEKLIFDVALSTPRRRRVAFAFTALGATVLYALSGLMFVPQVPVTTEKLDCAPYVDDATWVSPSVLVAQVSREHQIPAGREAELAAELKRHEPHTMRLVSLLSRSNPAPYAQTPNYHTVRMAAHLLTAQGVWLATHGARDAAMLHWVTALRFGRVMSRGTAGNPPVLIEGMIATAMQRSAIEAFQWFADTGRMTVPQWKLMRSELHARGQEPHSLKHYLAGERAFAERVFAQAKCDGGLPGSGPEVSMIRALSPLRLASRIEFIEQVRERFMQNADRVLAASSGNQTIVSPCEPPEPYEIIPALFSRARAVAVLTDAVTSIAQPNFKAAGERLEKVEAQARSLENSGPPLDLEGI